MCKIANYVMHMMRCAIFIKCKNDDGDRETKVRNVVVSPNSGDKKRSMRDRKNEERRGKSKCKGCGKERRWCVYEYVKDTKNCDKVPKKYARIRSQSMSER